MLVLRRSLNRRTSIDCCGRSPLLLLATSAHGYAGRVGDVLGEVREILVVEMGGQLEVVGGVEGGVGGGQVLNGAAVAAPVHVPASVRLRAQPVQRHAHLLHLGLLQTSGGIRGVGFAKKTMVIE